MQEPKYSVSQRMLQAMDETGLRQADIVERTGIPKSSINQYVTGYVEPKSDRLYKIAKAFGVTETWLMGYDVPMKPNKAQGKAQLLNQISQNTELMGYLEMLLSQDEVYQREAIDILRLVVTKNQQLQDNKKE